MFVPLYLLIPVVVLAAVALAERVLLPGVRAILRRRARALVEQINARLSLKLNPFKLTRKRVVEEILLHDPEVVAAASRHRDEHGMSWDEVTDLLRAYVHEVVPTFDVYLYYRLAHWVAKRLARLIYRVRVSFVDRKALAELDPKTSVVFVMNHRSNFDYVLVAYLVSRHAAISYAVGEWARIWPLDTLIRRMGGFFVRRDSADPLYRKVLERYVQLASESGVTQGIFPEGRLSRDGRLGEPRVGLLHYLLRKFDPVHGPDLVFVPVGINYDRVVEDRNLIMGASNERQSARKAVSAAVGWFGRIALLVARGGSARLGAACVTFGVPVSVREVLVAAGKDLRTLPGEEYRAEVKRIAETIMGAVANTIPATPVAVMCRALLAVGFEDVDEGTVLDEVARLAAELSSHPGILVSPRRGADLYREAVRVLARRQVMTVGDETLTVAPYDRPLLEYYANSISHHFGDSRAASPR